MSARAVALRVFLLVFAVALFLGTGETALRVIYRDAGRATLGGPPGGSQFHHDTIRDDIRGRLAHGAKTPGQPRVMILGDSITWGQGVRDWRKTWPELLAVKLEAAGHPHEFSVLALPGRDIPAHVQELEAWAGEVQPDIFVYQWYVNDLEVSQANRPRNRRWWHRLALHDVLWRWSYLYYFVDNRLVTYLPPTERSYVDYILQDYAPGSFEWTEFERYFHRLATRAKELSPRRIFVLYPQVPFKDRSPLQPVYDRMIALVSKPHSLSIPPMTWIRHAGTVARDEDAPWKQVVQVSNGAAGAVADTREYYFSAGPTPVVARIKSAAAGTVASIDALDAANHVLASAPLNSDGAPGFQHLRGTLTLPAAGAVRLRVNAAGGAAFDLAAIELPADYGFDVVDLTPALNTFNTHTSIFDAHPNERAHVVIADAVYQALTDRK